MTDWSLPILGPLAWIDVLVLAWLALCTISVVYMLWDTRRTPEPTVMKWGWILVTVYMGPIGAALYILADKEPVPGSHEDFVRPLWKQGIGSTVHCIAGDATGIVFAATVTALLGFPMWVDIVVEYIFGFAFGLFVFQALFMKSMFGGSYSRALKHSFIPEWLSMNLMMAGMILVMVPGMMGRDMRAMDPAEVLYWGVMSAGIIAGFLAAYPVNLWLVDAQLKHGLMTVRGAVPGHERQATSPHEAPAPAHQHGGAS